MHCGPRGPGALGALDLSTARRHRYTPPLHNAITATHRHYTTPLHNAITATHRQLMGGKHFGK
ncbi:unnamed protein product, partial [Boreogadus saida]